jgi:NhaP-type Na+/H+ or K+/H+ antiporter
MHDHIAFLLTALLILLFGLAWFGPRGIASVLYLLMAIGILGMTGNEYPMAIMILVIMMSVLLHGISAVPLVKRYSELQVEKGRRP